MKKRHISLSAQILTLVIIMVVLVSLAISIIFMVNINSLTEENIKTQAEISLKYLNADFRLVMTSFTDIVENGAAIFDAISDSKAAEEILIELAATIPDILSMYYGSVISRHSPGGVYMTVPAGNLSTNGTRRTVCGIKRQWLLPAQPCW